MTISPNFKPKILCTGTVLVVQQRTCRVVQQHLSNRCFYYMASNVVDGGTKVSTTMRDKRNNILIENKMNII